MWSEIGEMLMHCNVLRHPWGAFGALVISALLSAGIARSADGAPQPGAGAAAAFVRNFFAAFDRRVNGN